MINPLTGGLEPFTGIVGDAAVPPYLWALIPRGMSHSGLGPERQVPAADTMPLDHGDGSQEIFIRDGLQHPTEAIDRFLLAEVAATEEDKPRLFRPGDRQKPWVVEVGRGHDAPLPPGPLGDLGIGRPLEADVGRMDCIVPPLPQPARKRRREGHVHQPLHRARSTVSSSASAAAYRRASSMSSGSK